MTDGLLASTAVRLEAVIARAQADGRLPSLVAGVVRGGSLVWTGTRGTTVRDGSIGRADVDTQYRIGSITKTFTAALVLQLRSEGLLDLSDPVSRHVPEGPFGDATLRALLSHGAGLPAEPAGPWWERSPGVGYGGLVAANADAPQVLPVGERYHYSNLAYGVLGGVVERILGCSWYEAVGHHLLRPLALRRTTYAEAEPYAHGYSVEASTGMLTPEPHQDTGAMAPAGQMWSTVSDLARWMHLLARADSTILPEATVTAMSTPQTADPDENLTGAYGLGLRLSGPGPRVLVGHGGSMPGFLAGMFVDRTTAVGAVVLANGGYGLDVEAVPRALIETVLEHEPPAAREWSPTTTVDDASRELLGTWFWGNAPFEMTYDGTRLSLRARHAVKGVTFDPSGVDTWVGRAGYQTGETMRVFRRVDGVVSHLDIGTFCYTRVPYDPSAPIPGAGDER